ncbi:MAG: methylmalonyl Co-A mutase-associated GTPase MeaB [Bacteroidales bacterium]|jgi:LAO/AO transport system kinase|nr:methylmalonyl Co-A mutase-associated GTPase MeaB [Bacteroidales bacterium]MCK9499513.1 methylmalonyl Co-A mutase-associated GTPase MeaB [Bacteroidales bacterium]MDY0314831.1 methylmalonyl Co-A mutase-associated GTPase MeaB [Bacteroidales bacterium]NLB86293.1 methylmalonyl Co-A mutase-associated GTPase MeaB [Bacteroidales bacterium]
MTNKKKYIGEVEESKAGNSALKVNQGIEQPPQVNPSFRKYKRVKRILTISDYVNGILAGNVNVLSQAITLVESRLPEHQDLAQQIIEKCLSLGKKSVRLGITGVPGVGKSTFIEALGMEVVNKGHKLAVLAVDPSSERSGGSILGDKTRMEELSVQKNAFIRPSPSAGSLGGVARKTRESIVLCEAAGYDTIFIETVGVGQSETAVHSMVDFFLLLMLSGAGDELQGIKRGIMEMADAIAITKADGNNVQKAKLAQAQYQNALHLFPQTESKWTPIVLTCSSLEKTGIGEIWETIKNYETHARENGFFEKNRLRQSKYWLFEALNAALKERFYDDSLVKTELKKLEIEIENDKISSFVAASKLLDIYFKKK